MKKFVLAAALVLVSAAASADNHIEYRIRNDRNYEQNRAKAVRMLEKRGYHVRKIQADDYRGHPVLEAEAYKNGREYDIKLSYPNLRIVKERIDD
jgi:hypothetical periplasmic protein